MLNSPMASLAAVDYDSQRNVPKGGREKDWGTYAGSADGSPVTTVC